MTSVTIKVIDNRGKPGVNNSGSSVGLFNGKPAHFMLKAEFNEEENRRDETLLIKYGNLKDFALCSVYPAGMNGYVFVNGYLYGNMGDIMLDADQWLKILKKLGSTQKLNEWTEKLINKVAA